MSIGGIPPEVGRRTRRGLRARRSRTAAGGQVCEECLAGAPLIVYTQVW